jgi:hypothetical protein
MFCCQEEKVIAKKTDEIITEQPKETPVMDPVEVSDSSPKNTDIPETEPPLETAIEKWIETIWLYTPTSLIPEKLPSHRILLAPQQTDTIPKKAEYPLHAQALVDIPLEIDILSSFTPTLCPLSINVKNILGASRTFTEVSALHLACFRGNVDFVQWYLAQYSPDLTQVCITWSEAMKEERKWSVMDCAVASGNYEVEELIRDQNRKE